MRPMDSMRHVARLDRAIRALNGGDLPVFSVRFNGESRGDVVPGDGTPETALDIAQRAMMPHDDDVVEVELRAETATPIMLACPGFYQGVTRLSATGPR